MDNKSTSYFDKLKNLDFSAKADPAIENKARKLKEKQKIKDAGQEKNRRYAVIHVGPDAGGSSSEYNEIPPSIDNISRHPKGFVRAGSSYIPKSQQVDTYVRPDEETPHETQRRKQIEQFAKNFTQNRIREWNDTQDEAIDSNAENATIPQEEQAQDMPADKLIIKSIPEKSSGVARALSKATENEGDYVDFEPVTKTSELVPVPPAPETAKNESTAKGPAEIIDEQLVDLKVGEKIEVTEHGEKIVYTIQSLPTDVTDGMATIEVGGVTDVVPISRMKKHLVLPGVSFLRPTKEAANTAPDAVEQKEQALLTKQFNLFLANELADIESNGRRDKTSLYMALSEKYNLGIESIEEIETPEEKEIQDNIERDRRETLKKIGEILKNGIDKVVVHGRTQEDEDGNLNVTSQPDADTEAALYLLSTIGNIQYKEGANTEIVETGGQIPEEADKVILYVDVGNKSLSVVDKKTNKVVFFDHHPEEFEEHQTSATELVYETLLQNNINNIDNLPPKDKIALEKFVEFITSIDNLSYADEPDFPKRFKYDWAGSMYAIAKQLPIEAVLQFFREGRDPWKPNFTDSEKKNSIWNGKPKIDQVTGKQLYEKNSSKIDTTPIITQTADGKNAVTYKVDQNGNTIEPIVAYKQIALGQILNKMSNDYHDALTEGFPLAVEEMEEKGLIIETKEAGRILFNTTDVKESGKIGKNGKPRNVNWLKGELGFLMAKAHGYDSYASFNNGEGHIGKSNGYFFNNTTHDLTPIINALREVVPGTVLVRGVMILGPKASKERQAMTEEVFLRKIGMLK